MSNNRQPQSRPLIGSLDSLGLFLTQVDRPQHAVVE